MGAQTSRRSDVVVAVSVASPTSDSYDGDVEDLDKTFASLQMEPHESTSEEFDVEKFRKVNQKVVSTAAEGEGKEEEAEARVERKDETSSAKHLDLPQYDFVDEQIIASIEKEMMTSEYY